LHLIQSAYPSLISFLDSFCFFCSIVSRSLPLKQTHQNFCFLF
jgi:hypothetical protein